MYKVKSCFITAKRSSGVFRNAVQGKDLSTQNAVIKIIPRNQWDSVLLYLQKHQGQGRKHYLPVNWGGRFSLKAAIPSWRSLVGIFYI